MTPSKRPVCDIHHEAQNHQPETGQRLLNRRPAGKHEVKE